MRSTIEDFFADQTLLVTGGTGFLGKVLIEKLLRSCSKIKSIYVLIRSNKGKNAEQRLKETLQFPLFDRLRNEQPDVMTKKLIALDGDIREINLGLSDDIRKLLVREVSIIFHAAATVRFDQPIQEAIIMNTRGTREIVCLAKEIKNLVAFVHISTTYCNCNRRIVEEIVYPAPMDWRKAIQLAETTDPKLFMTLSEKFLGGFPNTYTFTKSLAEKLVYEECNGVIPTVIFRPSIVVSSVEEPMSGWIDNFNGPVGLVIGVGKGVVRTIFAKEEAVADYMPVDIAIKAIIVACWNQTTKSDPKNRLDVSVYNASSTTKSISMLQVMETGLTGAFIYPFPETLWFPRVLFTTNKIRFYLNTLLTQVLPAICVDAVFYLTNKKPINLSKIQRKIYQASTALSYFTSKSWWFENSNFLRLLDEIPDCDKSAFDFEFQHLDVNAYFMDAIVGGHKYLLRTDMSLLPGAAKRVKVLYYVDITIKTAFWMVVAFLLYTKFILPTIIYLTEV